MVATTFATVDPAVSTFMKSMVMDYLVKNALANGNETDAAAAVWKNV
jgi:hypothetical protein